MLIYFVWEIIQGFLLLQFLKGITGMSWEMLKSNDGKNVKNSN